MKFLSRASPRAAREDGGTECFACSPTENQIENNIWDRHTSSKRGYLGILNIARHTQLTAFLFFFPGGWDGHPPALRDKPVSPLEIVIALKKDFQEFHCLNGP